MGYIRRIKKKKGCKRNRGAEAFYGKVYSIDRKGIGITVFHARQRGKQPFLLIEKAIGNKIGTWYGDIYQARGG